ncbi:MAG: hypothetical protein U5R48_12510 [Gammaproteobacteria bacterium]|nr:hypothetical protein [Gammaproteobacteria bacterium]
MKIRRSCLRASRTRAVLHVVDLDAARGDANNNRDAIADLCDALDIPVPAGRGHPLR